MRRKRRTKYTWFPLLGNDTLDGDPAGIVTQIDFEPPEAPVAGNGVPSDVTLFPVVFDFPTDAANASTTQGLNDLIGNEYILKRIVGKCHIGANVGNIDNANRAPPSQVISCGFFIARADENGSQPIASATSNERIENYGPLMAENCREPWIWRRTWALGTMECKPDLSGNLQFRTFAQGQVILPTDNYCGSVADGPHIDSKVARRVGNDDRLWFAVQTAGIDAGFGSGATGAFFGVLDIRVLGALRKARGRSAF